MKLEPASESVQPSDDQCRPPSRFSYTSRPTPMCRRDTRQRVLKWGPDLWDRAPATDGLEKLPEMVVNTFLHDRQFQRCVSHWLRLRFLARPLLASKPRRRARKCEHDDNPHVCRTARRTFRSVQHFSRPSRHRRRRRRRRRRRHRRRRRRGRRSGNRVRGAPLFGAYQRNARPGLATGSSNRWFSARVGRGLRRASVRARMRAAGGRATRQKRTRSPT